ncbi:MAG TPA: HAD-IIB family hydrolase [Verrucomicrobiales bacterium]|nr:HAD-IIB family hydrolase [Verrucomicrobiales bacterium]HIL68274.1 HAD-IIB family hydrolase [Verrucomicrobiota bacterium]
MSAHVSIHSFSQCPASELKRIRYVLCDIDDTLTWQGKLPAEAYSSIEDLNKAGIQVIPITGRPAGWCDHISRMWPVAGVVGENGAFFFSCHHSDRRMIRRYFKDEEERKEDRIKLNQIQTDILKAIPGCRVAADQPYREADLAIDFCEEIQPPLDSTEVQRIVEIFEEQGAQAKVSSIHVNGWFGHYDKLAMTRRLFAELFRRNLEEEKSECLFVGDSPNDEPMFEFFPLSVGVANVMAFNDQLVHPPKWITKSPGGAGFAETADRILEIVFSQENL